MNILVSFPLSSDADGSCGTCCHADSGCTHDALPSLTLVHTTSCNLRCSYCFQLDHRADCAGRIDSAMVPGVVALIRRMAGSSSFRVRHFGGEPLLNFPVIREIVEATADNPLIEHSITTNGTLLDAEMAAFIVRHKILVIVSMDGDEATHDACRRDAAGRGTHARILSALALLPPGHPVHIKSTLADEVQIADALRFLVPLGRDVEINRVSATSKPQICGLDVAPALVPTGEIIPCHGYLILEDWRKHSIGSLADGVDEARLLASRRSPKTCVAFLGGQVEAGVR